MRCPFCSEPDTKVLDSRSVEDDECIRRRRECIKCGRRFTTHERLDEVPLMVIKKDKRREPFNISKITSGIVNASIKRPISMEAIEDLAASVEREARNLYEREVESSAIGEMVMDRLRELDQIAYVRFASVYRQFTDLERFKQELERLL